jgi:RNA recognition motif-containing protein
MPRGSTELFLGGLSKDTRRSDLEEVFGKYGRIIRCDIKYVNGYAGTAYGFVGYDDDRDAEVSMNKLFFCLNS